MIQRILSVLFVMLLLLSAAGPAIAVYATEESTNTDTTSANESDTTIPETTEPEPTDNTRVSGTCGSNISWVLDKTTGTLTVSGTGVLAAEGTYWEVYQSQLKAVVIQEGITCIDTQLFENSKNLQRVTLPNSLTHINACAFSGCSSLSSIHLGDQITHIGHSAFGGCSSLSHVNIPASLTTIDNYAFANSGLQSLSIPGTVTSIGDNAFSGCSQLSELSLSEGLKTLGRYAFSSCPQLTNLVLPDSLQKMDTGTFQACTGLTEVNIPNTLRDIPDRAFANCTNLKKVNLGASVQSLHVKAFKGCSKLTVFTVNPSNPYFCTIENALYTKDKTELIQIPSGYAGTFHVAPGTEIIQQYAAYGRSSLTGLVIPSSVTVISHSAFENCNNLSYISFASGLSEIYDSVFLDCTALTSIRFPSTLSLIGRYAFSGCKNITEIIFTGDAPEIRSAAFYNVNATGYYPGNKAHWDEATELYSDILNWKIISCDSGHKEVTLPAEAASCTANGITEGVECSVCGKAISGRKIIPALGHTFTDWVLVKAPTETENGLEERSCSVCSETEQRTLPRIGEEGSGSAEQPAAPTDPDTTQPDPTDDPTQQTQPDTQDTPTYTTSPESTDSTTGGQEEVPDDQPSKIDTEDLIKIVCIGVLLAGGLVVFLAQRKRS